MKRIREIVGILLTAGLVFGAAACDETEEGSASTCGADLQLQVGAASCDFTANQVECFYTTEIDNDAELEVVSCAGETDSCEFEFIIALHEGEPVDGMIGMFDEAADYEAEGKLVPDVWNLQLTDSQMTVSFSGALADDSSIDVAGCIDGIPWTEGMLDEEEDDDDGSSGDN